MSSLADILPGALVWDNHACMPLRPDDLSFLPELKRARETGVDIVTLNAGCMQDADAHFAMIAAFKAWIAAYPSDFLQIERVDDIAAAKAQGKTGICFDVEGASALDGDLSNVARLYDLGVRWMLPTYNAANAFGGGCIDAEDKGLTAFGRELVKEMNRVGMVVCATHAGYRTAREIIDFSAHPAIFSHSNPRALHDHPRNLPDDLIKACAARGGVIGINGVGVFLGGRDKGCEAFVDHIEYTLDLVGDDHVGIALDYVYDQAELKAFIVNNPAIFPGFDTPELAMLAHRQLPAIAQRLLQRGHSHATLAKLFGANHLRIARQVWREPQTRARSSPR